MINEDYVYLAEKLRDARRALMLPHPKDETEGMICRAGEGAASATPAGEAWQNETSGSHASSAGAAGKMQPHVLRQ